MYIVLRNLDCHFIQEDNKITEHFTLLEGWFDATLMLEQLIEKLDAYNFEDVNDVTIIFDEPWVNIKIKNLPNLSLNKTKQMFINNFADEYLDDIAEKNISFVSHKTKLGQKHHVIYTIQNSIISILKEYFIEKNMNNIYLFSYHQILLRHFIRNNLHQSDGIQIYISDDACYVFYFVDQLLQESIKIFKTQNDDTNTFLSKIEQQFNYLQFRYPHIEKVQVVNGSYELMDYFSAKNSNSSIKEIASDIEYHKLSDLIQSGQNDQKLINYGIKKHPLFNEFINSTNNIVITVGCSLLIVFFLSASLYLHSLQKQNDLEYFQGQLAKTAEIYLPQFKNADNIDQLIQRKYNQEVTKWGNKKVTQKREYLISEILLSFNSMKIHSQAKLSEFTFDHKDGVTLKGVVKSLNALNKAQEKLREQLTQYKIDSKYNVIDLNVYFDFKLTPKIK